MASITLTIPPDKEIWVFTGLLKAWRFDEEANGRTQGEFFRDNLNRVLKGIARDGNMEIEFERLFAEGEAIILT